MKKIVMGIFLMIMLIISMFALTGCNKQLIDTTYTFNKAITYIGDERLEIEIKSWNDYDGEQIQIEAKDGKTYLLSMNNTMLIRE